MYCNTCLMEEPGHESWIFGCRSVMDRAITLTIGVVSDTHVPDYASALHPGLTEALSAAGVQHILHAGDICTPMVLKDLGRVAPVTAVRGNRDWLFQNSLPWVRSIKLAGVSIAIVHGHGSWGNYLQDKLYYYLEGYRLDRYKSLLHGAVPEAKVVVFGHTHYSEVCWDVGKLLFNPGSATITMKGYSGPSFGLLRIYPGALVEAEVVELRGAKLQNRNWVGLDQ